MLLFTPGFDITPQLSNQLGYLMIGALALYLSVGILVIFTVNTRNLIRKVKRYYYIRRAKKEMEEAREEALPSQTFMVKRFIQRLREAEREGEQPRGALGLSERAEESGRRALLAVEEGEGAAVGCAAASRAAGVLLNIR